MADVYTPFELFGTEANTSIKYNFRTSITGTGNDADWTAWSADQTIASGTEKDITSLVTSKTGDPGSETFYKYIQVKSTLTSTDGTSTPIIEDYTIGYHTNVAPAKPVAGSVTIGS